MTTIPNIDQNTINALNAANAVGNSANVADTQDSRTRLADNYNTFLTLLTAQLQNQDPLSPMDSTQFTQQLVQFSQVEQQIRTNEELNTLVTQYQAASAGSALSYLGRDAILASSVATLGSSEGAKANWAYAFDKTPSTATLSVKDAAGHIVYSQDGDLTSGDHLFSWDGKETSGAQAPAGVYTLVVTAKDSSGNTINPTITTRETIMGVDFTSSTPTVITQSGSHGIDAVRAILNNAS
ncbi:MAG TPA: flagellar hook capping FlgD N-terminal domain-containing protein [Caulobacterales bacterium]|nr:flagellar hook capping FlgD N-terminal domain-containing protein [Caulobacterales bacterium]